VNEGDKDAFLVSIDDYQSQAFKDDAATKPQLSPAGANGPRRSAIPKGALRIEEDAKEESSPSTFTLEESEKDSSGLSSSDESDSELSIDSFISEELSDSGDEKKPEGSESPSKTDEAGDFMKDLISNNVDDKELATDKLLLVETNENLFVQYANKKLEENTNLSMRAAKQSI